MPFSWFIPKPVIDLGFRGLFRQFQSFRMQAHSNIMLRVCVPLTSDWETCPCASLVQGNASFGYVRYWAHPSVDFAQSGNNMLSGFVVWVRAHFPAVHVFPHGVHDLLFVTVVCFIFLFYFNSLE